MRSKTDCKTTVGGGGGGVIAWDNGKWEISCMRGGRGAGAVLHTVWGCGFCDKQGSRTYACARLLLLLAAKAVIVHAASGQSELLMRMQGEREVRWRISSIVRGVLFV